MDTQKLFKQIDKLKEEQVNKYSSCIKNLINKYPDYYKDKDYARVFINKK